MRRVKENTSAVLLQSGLNENWLADSMECYTYLRIGKPFKGPIIPFGSLVDYYTNCEGPVKIPSIWKESLTWIAPRIRIVGGEDLEG